MPKYCVNRNAQPTGEHEVHEEGCQYMPEGDNCIPLGWHVDCQGAIKKASDFYNNIDGCYNCCRPCHTR